MDVFIKETSIGVLSAWVPYIAQSPSLTKQILTKNLVVWVLMLRSNHEFMITVEFKLHNLCVLKYCFYLVKHLSYYLKLPLDTAEDKC